MFTVYLEHNQFISTITEIWPVLFMHDWQIYEYKTVIQMHGNIICNSLL